MEQNKKPVDWWDYLDWETMQNTWWRFPETVRQQLREKGINPSYDSLTEKITKEME